MDNLDKLQKQVDAANLTAQMTEAVNSGLKDNGASGEDLFMGLTAWGLLLALLFSLIGTSYLIYGKKRSNLVVGLCGVGLLTYTLFVSSTLWLLVIGGLLTFLPTILRRLGV